MDRTSRPKTAGLARSRSKSSLGFKPEARLDASHKLVPSFSQIRPDATVWERRLALSDDVQKVKASLRQAELVTHTMRKKLVAIDQKLENRDNSVTKLQRAQKEAKDAQQRMASLPHWHKHLVQSQKEKRMRSHKEEQSVARQREKMETLEMMLKARDREIQLRMRDPGYKKSQKLNEELKRSQAECVCFRRIVGERFQRQEGVNVEEQKQLLDWSVINDNVDEEKRVLKGDISALTAHNKLLEKEIQELEDAMLEEEQKRVSLLRSQRPGSSLSLSLNLPSSDPVLLSSRVEDGEGLDAIDMIDSRPPLTERTPQMQQPQPPSKTIPTKRNPRVKSARRTR